MEMDQNEPEKPKPTTYGTQMEGPAYSTRSKAKRTSNSEDNSIGSQAHLPPPKRRTRRGAKQANKSVGINNDDSAPIDSIQTVDEYTSAETALRNDLVLETLFRYMNRSDLLSCRLVNKKWQYEATTELRRRKLVIRLSFHRYGYQKGRYMLFQNICRRLSECRTPSLLSSFQVKVVISNELGSTGVRNIFTTVGSQLKHLKLHLNYFGKTSSFVRSSLMTDLQNLLCRQAPNLEFVEIEFDFPFHWEDEVKTLNSSNDQPHNDKNEFLMMLPNLKTFIVNGSPPAKFFKDVINAAVNLRSMGGAWSAYLMGAEEMRDKIFLLKSLQLAVIAGVPWHNLDLELMESFLTEHKQNLKLETFECLNEFICEDAHVFAPRIVGVMDQILESGAGSLLKLRIEPTKGFEDIIIPRLPKLQEICFDCYYIIRMAIISGDFFPRGFNMNHSFPNVSSIVILEFDGFRIRSVCVPHGD